MEFIAEDMEEKETQASPDSVHKITPGDENAPVHKIQRKQPCTSPKTDLLCAHTCTDLLRKPVHGFARVVEFIVYFAGIPK